MQPKITNSVLLLAASANYVAAIGRAPEGAIVLPLTYNEFTAAYYAPFHIGTPPQLEYLRVDTGSPTMSFLDSRSSFCNGTDQPCKVYGSFDNYTSSYVIAKSVTCFSSTDKRRIEHVLTKERVSLMNCRMLVLVPTLTIPSR